MKKQFLSFLSRKASKRRAESEEASAVLALPAEGEEDYVHRAESNPRGNWLWQLATELVPKEGDVTDVLTPDLPPPHNKYRNPKCHPDVKPHEVCGDVMCVCMCA